MTVSSMARLKSYEDMEYKGLLSPGGTRRDPAPAAKLPIHPCFSKVANDSDCSDARVARAAPTLHLKAGSQREYIDPTVPIKRQRLSISIQPDSAGPAGPNTAERRTSNAGNTPRPANWTLSDLPASGARPPTSPVGRGPPGNMNMG